MCLVILLLNENFLNCLKKKKKRGAVKVFENNLSNSKSKSSNCEHIVILFTFVFTRGLNSIRCWQFIFFLLYFHLYPILWSCNDPISPRGSLKFHLILSYLPHPSPLPYHLSAPPFSSNPSLNYVLWMKFIFHAASSRQRGSPVLGYLIMVQGLN